MRDFPIVLWFTIAILSPVMKVHAQGTTEVIRLDPTLDEIVPADAKMEKLADDFSAVEGPVWVRKGRYLLFSDIPANVIDKWTPNGKVTLFLKPSGFTGADPSDVGFQFNNGRSLVTLIGSNGVTLDRQGRVVFCAHGDRAVVRLENDGRRTVLADRYEGKRLNSPNDLVYKSDGALYFTDPPAGLREGGKDPKKELPFNGVYLLAKQKLQLLVKEMPLPNGLAFSPDEKYIYISDTVNKSIMRYEVRADDTIADGQLFADMTLDNAPGHLDGIKIDKKGNVYCTAPGGFWIISSAGKHLGTVKTPVEISNLAFGDADGKMLYITARTSLYRIQLKIPGIRP